MAVLRPSRTTPTLPRWRRKGDTSVHAASMGDVDLKVQPSQTRPGEWVWMVHRPAKLFSGVAAFDRYSYADSKALAQLAAENAAEQAPRGQE